MIEYRWQLNVRERAEKPYVVRSTMNSVMVLNGVVGGLVDIRGAVWYFALDYLSHWTMEPVSVEQEPSDGS